MTLLASEILPFGDNKKIAATLILLLLELFIEGRFYWFLYKKNFQVLEFLKKNTILQKCKAFFTQNLLETPRMISRKPLMITCPNQKVSKKILLHSRFPFVFASV